MSQSTGCRTRCSWIAGRHTVCRGEPPSNAATVDHDPLGRGVATARRAAAVAAARGHRFLGSRNGTFVDEPRSRRRARRLTPGDVLTRVGFLHGRYAGRDPVWTFFGHRYVFEESLPSYEHAGGLPPSLCASRVFVRRWRAGAGRHRRPLTPMQFTFVALLHGGAPDRQQRTARLRLHGRAARGSALGLGLPERRSRQAARSTGTPTFRGYTAHIEARQTVDRLVLNDERETRSAAGEPSSSALSVAAASRHTDTPFHFRLHSAPRYTSARVCLLSFYQSPIDSSGARRPSRSFTSTEPAHVDQFKREFHSHVDLARRIG